MSKRVFTALCLGSLVFALGCSQSVKPEHLGDIAPGEGIKGLALEAERSEVEKSWGTPDDVYENPFDKKNVIVAYHDKGVEVSYVMDKVDCVNLYAQKDSWKPYEGATKDGVWVNSTDQDVRKILGQPLSEAPQALNYPGLTVYLQNGKVDYLAVVSKYSDAPEVSAPVEAPTLETSTAASDGPEEDSPAADAIQRLRRSAAEVEKK